MKMLFIIPVLVILAGCGNGTLRYADMGATAKCLHDAETLRKVLEHMDKDLSGSPEATKRYYQSKVNECMWVKAQAKKD
jgi:hypothetical protein